MRLCNERARRLVLEFLTLDVTFTLIHGFNLVTTVAFGLIAHISLCGPLLSHYPSRPTILGPCLNRLFNRLLQPQLSWMESLIRGCLFFSPIMSPKLSCRFQTFTILHSRSETRVVHFLPSYFKNQHNHLTSNGHSNNQLFGGEASLVLQ